MLKCSSNNTQKNKIKVSNGRKCEKFVILEIHSKYSGSICDNLVIYYCTCYCLSDTDVLR